MLLRRIDRKLDACLRESDERVAFLRELNLRSERVLGELAERIAEGTRELREHRGEFAERHQELLEESRAQRAALFRILDRLDDGGSSAGA